jgi:acetyl esterase/lipase
VVEAPRPPGPFAFPAELAPPVTDPLTGGVRYAGIEFARVWGYRPLRLDLVLPPSAPGQVPVVVWVHGGMWLFGSRLEGPGTRAACRALLERGVAVAQVEYRFSREILFPGCLHDVKAAVRWLRANAAEYGLDPDRIALGGASAGGHLASLAALTTGDAALEGDVGQHLGVSSAVGAVVAYFPGSDLLLSGGRNELETRILPPPPTAALLGLQRIDDDPELVRSASPRYRVHPGAPPHLVLHGDRDTMVNHEQGRLLHDALSSVGASSTFVLLGGAGHEGPEFVSPAITALVAGFLAEKLG